MCIPGFVFGYSKKYHWNWRLKVHYMAMSCWRRGPLRFVCGQTVNTTAMIYTFMESPSDLDVHPGKHFALFDRNRRNWRRRSRHKKQRNLLFALQLCFLHLCISAFCWHTGDNVRLSDVVKFIYAYFETNRKLPSFRRFTFYSKITYKKVP